MVRLFISPSSQEANVGPGGYVEEVYMNLVADILCPELTRHGIEFMRNSKGDTYAGHVAKSNLYKPDFHIAIHSNAGGTTARGCVVFCYKPDTYPNRPGTLMAKSIYKYIEALTPVADRGVKDGTAILSEVAKTNAPAVLIEVDFHDKVDGAAWLMAHIPEIAQAILLGILEKLAIKYIPKTPVPVPVDYKAKYEAEVVKNEQLSVKLSDVSSKLQLATIAVKELAELKAKLLVLSQ